MDCVLSWEPINIYRGLNDRQIGFLLGVRYAAQIARTHRTSPCSPNNERNQIALAIDDSVRMVDQIPTLFE